MTRKTSYIIKLNQENCVTFFICRAQLRNVLTVIFWCFFYSICSSGARRGTYAAPSGGVGRRRRAAGGGQSGHSANSGDSLADDDEDA